MHHSLKKMVLNIDDIGFFFFFEILFFLSNVMYALFSRYAFLKRSEASFILWAVLKNTDKVRAKSGHLPIINFCPSAIARTGKFLADYG